MSDSAIMKVGIVGSGRMGEDIFYHLVEFDFPLVWVFRNQEHRDKAVDKFNKRLKRLLKAGALDDKGFAFRNDNTRITTQQGDLDDCNLIIETIVEDAETKRGLFLNLDASVRNDCIFVSNSSSIKPSKLWPDSERRDRFAGFHFFFPVRFYKSVEIITTDRCSAATVVALKDFAKRIGKIALILPEKGAFILNKAFIYEQAQAFHTRKENFLSCREIDDLIKKHIFAMGTFEFLDHVGLDVILAASKQYLEDMKHKDFIAITIEEVQKLVDIGHLGVKSGQGFYAYGKDVVEESPGSGFASSEEREKYEEDVVNKIICLYINLAYDFVDKGYCTEAELETALAEYKGMEKGPVALGKEIGFGKVHDLLMDYCGRTGEKVFYPSLSLKKRVELGKE